jgi:transcriptional regulator with XRE-family HTH domain
MKILDEMQQNVLNRILELKDKNNYSDREFGIKSGLGEKVIDNWKRGASTSYMKNLDKLADFFNVSSHYLLYGNIIDLSEFQSENKIDISKKLDTILKQLEDPQVATVFNGTPMSNTAKAMLIKSFKKSIENMKIIENKENKKSE